MYFLHFHEGSQKFCIIPTGVTITEAYDGVSILTSHKIILTPVLHFLNTLTLIRHK